MASPEAMQRAYDVSFGCGCCDGRGPEAIYTEIADRIDDEREAIAKQLEDHVAQFKGVMVHDPAIVALRNWVSIIRERKPSPEVAD
jgi:hypothetical protein